MPSDRTTRAGALARADLPMLGIGLALLGSFCFVVQDSGLKWLSTELAVVQILFVRCLFSLVYLTAGTAMAGRRIKLRSSRPGMLCLRTILNILSWYAFFSGLKYLPLAEATALFFSFPLFLTILSGPFLGEKVGLRRWLAIMVGFVGVIFMTRPGYGFTWPMALMLLAAFGWASVATMTRVLGKTEEAGTMLFYNLFGFALAMVLPQFWVWRDISMEALGLLAAISAFGVVAQLCLIKAYSVASPSIVAPFEYTGLIWAAVFGFVIWGDVPDAWVISGALLIVASGLYIVRREALFSRASAGPR